MEPLPLIAIKRLIDEIRGGEVVEMLFDDPSGDPEIRAWSKMTGHTVLDTYFRDEWYCIYVQKQLKETKENTMGDFNINKTLDCSGMLCPLPVVKTNKALKELAVGEIIEMISTDPGSKPDMEAWARQTKHDLLETTEDGSKFRFVIKKTH